MKKKKLILKLQYYLLSGTLRHQPPYDPNLYPGVKFSTIDEDQEFSDPDPMDVGISSEDEDDKDDKDDDRDDNRDDEDFVLSDQVNIFSIII